MDPATIMMIISTMAKVAEASKSDPPQPAGAGQPTAPPPNTAAQLMTARAQAGQPQPERTKLQQIVDDTMKNPGMTPQLQQKLAAEQQKKPTLEEVEERQRGEGPGTLDKIAMGAEIGNSLRGAMGKPPSPRMMNFGSAATSGPEPTSTRFRRERASKLNDYVRALLRRR